MRMRGKRLFPATKNQSACDDFNPGEAYNYSLLPFLYMKPGALGKHESYFLEFLDYIDSQSPYRERVLRKRGLGGFSMGGFGAMKLGLKHPQLFQSLSSQSGLLDIESLTDKWMLQMMMPEFLEVFGSLEAQKASLKLFARLEIYPRQQPVDSDQEKRDKPPTPLDLF